GKTKNCERKISMKCEIVKDLLPSYIDGLTSNESNSEIEEHLKTCEECTEILDQMKIEVNVENIVLNKEIIKPFKKLNKRVLQSVLITLAVCILAVGSYFYFFEIGWKVNSEDMDIKYSYKDDSIRIDFELTNGKVLNSWTNHHNWPEPAVITFTECYDSVFDDIGNGFSYGIREEDKYGKMKKFTDDDCIILHFKDKTETLYLKEIAEELGLQ
ncbi:MAG: zf-HC2 domain-containing protein, partial [Bacillota bacterium]